MCETAAAAEVRGTGVKDVHTTGRLSMRQLCECARGFRVYYCISVDKGVALVGPPEFSLLRRYDIDPLRLHNGGACWRVGKRGSAADYQLSGADHRKRKSVRWRWRVQILSCQQQWDGDVLEQRRIRPRRN